MIRLESRYERAPLCLNSQSFRTCNPVNGRTRYPWYVYGLIYHTGRWYEGEDYSLRVRSEMGREDHSAKRVG
jgi:hypothetical protein